MSKLTVLSVPGLASWATYLVNDDSSALSTEDAAAADKWFREICEEHPFASAVTVMTASEESYDARFDGKLSDMLDYTIHVHTPERVTITADVDQLQVALRALLLAESSYQRFADKAQPFSDESWNNRLQAAAMKAARIHLVARLPGVKG